MTRNKLWLGLASLMLLWAGTARADYLATVYANSAGGDGIQVFNLDVTTGAETLANHITQSQLGNSGNGRGVVVVGNTMYYTFATSNSVFAYDLSTNTNLGAVFSVAGASGLASASWDGSHILLGDYSGTDHVYEYTLGGTLVNTISLDGCSSPHQGNLAGFCDGLTNTGTALVSNEGDGGFGGPSQYDVYSFAGGAPTQSGLITTTYGATGIAFDGTYFYVSDINHDAIDVFTATGAHVEEIALTNGDHTHAIEGLSVNYNLVIPPSGVPEPSSLMTLAGLGLISLCVFRRGKV